MGKNSLRWISRRRSRRLRFNRRCHFDALITEKYRIIFFIFNYMPTTVNAQWAARACDQTWDIEADTMYEALDLHTRAREAVSSCISKRFETFEIGFFGVMWSRVLHSPTSYHTRLPLLWCLVARRWQSGAEVYNAIGAARAIVVFCSFRLVVTRTTNVRRCTQS